MGKEHDETMVKSPTSISQEPEETNGSKAQNVFSERRSEINFDDEKYATKSLKKEQEPLKLRGFLKLIPIIGKSLVSIFTSKKEEYKKLQSQTDHFSEAKDETRIDDKHIKGVGSELKKSNIEQVDSEKSRGP